MKIGYLAVSQYGTTHRLTDANKHPRGQLLEKCGMKHCQKIYSDTEKGPVHVGYTTGREWWNIYEIHDWQTQTRKAG